MKIESIKTKLDKLEQGQTIGPYKIDIGYLTQDPTFQVRQKLDTGHLGRLKGAYKAGSEVTPITVGIIVDIPGKLVIVDGHHRVTALEIIWAEQCRTGTAKPMLVKAMFVKLTAAEARWQAAAANMVHGKGITNREVRKAFQRYVEAGQHRNADGSYKSNREIGKDIGKTHPTVRTWMIKDFPEEARQMKDDDMPANVGGTGIPSPAAPAMHSTRDAMKEIMTHFNRAYSGERAEIIDALRAMLEDFEKAHSRTDAFAHDQNLRDEQVGRDDPDADF